MVLGSGFKCRLAHSDGQGLEQRRGPNLVSPRFGCGVIVRRSVFAKMMSKGIGLAPSVQAQHALLIGPEFAVRHAAFLYS